MFRFHQRLVKSPFMVLSTLIVPQAVYRFEFICWLIEMFSQPRVSNPNVVPNIQAKIINDIMAFFIVC